MKILLLLLLLSVPALGQIEYGTNADLKGLKKVFIDTGSDMETRTRLIKELDKAKLDLEVLSSIDNADIVMRFVSETNEKLVSANTVYGDYGASTTAARVELIAGVGQVFVAGKNGERPRLILSVKNSQQTKWEKRPSTKFILAFIKAYKDGNGIK